MSALGGWVVQIGALALILGMVEVLLPNTSLRGSVRLLVGLVVILAVIEPVVRWIGDPGVIDRLVQSVAVEDGRRYVEAGARLFDRSAEEASVAWEAGVERQLEALSAWVDGVREARVDVRTDGFFRIDAIVVEVEWEAGEPGDARSRVRRLIQGLVPAVDPDRIEINDR